MRKYLGRFVPVAAGVSLLMLIVVAAAYADGPDFSAVTGQFAAIATALTVGIVAAVAAAVGVGAIMKGSPAVWKMFWKFVGR